jgi:hypothetical protein
MLTRVKGKDKLKAWGLMLAKRGRRNNALPAVDSRRRRHQRHGNRRRHWRWVGVRERAATSLHGSGSSPVK